MSNKINDKQNGAIRLFEALSGVDEKYLASCEEDTGATSKGVVVLWHKYGKAMAAVLCLAVLGAGYLSIQQTNTTDKMASVSEAPMNQMAPTSQKDAYEAAPEAAIEGEVEISEQYLEPGAEETDGVVENGATSGSSAFDRVEQLEKFDLTAVRMPVEGEICDTGDIRTEMSLEELQDLPVIGKYVPTSWPEDGSLKTVLGVAEPGMESALMVWEYANQEDSFVIEVDYWNGYIPSVVESGLKEGVVVYNTHFTRDYLDRQITTSPEDTMETALPRGSVRVLYRDGANYVLVSFNGFAAVDDVWMLMN